MGNQVSSSPAPTPSQDYYQGDRYGGVVAAANMENHGAPQKLQRPYNNPVINSDEAVRIYGHCSSNMENHRAPQKLQRPYNNHVISSDEAVRIYGGICVTEKYGTNSAGTNKPTPVINRNRRYY